MGLDVAAASLEAEEMAALTSAEESNTLVACASLEAVAEAAKVVAVWTEPPASVT